MSSEIDRILAALGATNSMGGATDYDELQIGSLKIDTRFESTFDIIRKAALAENTPHILGTSDTCEAIVLRSEAAPGAQASIVPVGSAGANLIAYCKTINSDHTTLLPDPTSLDPTDFRSQALISAFPKFRYFAPNLMGLLPPGTKVMVTFDPGSLQSGIINSPGVPACIDVCPSGSAAFPGSMGPFAFGALGGFGPSGGSGPTASPKIGGFPPQRDGVHKNGVISCPDRAPIPVPERYTLDPNAPYASKLNPMTPLCRLLPKGELVEYSKATSTYSEAATQIKASWKKVSGESLTDAQASVLVGQWGSETGGGKSYFNWNPGGIKAYSKWKGKWVLVRTFEYASTEARECGKSCKTWVISPFRAFDSQEESITSWIRLLTGSRHGVGKPYILAADYMGYAKAIGPRAQGGSNYGTADPVRYGKLIKSLGEGWLSGAKV